MSTAVQPLTVPGPRQEPGTLGPDHGLGGSAAAARLAAEAGLRLLATGVWDGAEGTALPGIAGFIVSSFSPLAAEAARRAMTNLAAADDGIASDDDSSAVLLVSALGDVVSARAVAAAVDAADRVGPLMFFQSVPNAIAGYIASTWRLTGPVVAISPADDALGSGMAEAIAMARLLLDDGDATRVLVVLVEQAADADQSDRALALVLDQVEGEENR